MWKQKGEEYRVTGTGGWIWLSALRQYRYVPQNTVGLRGVVQKLCARAARLARQREKEAKKEVKLEPVKQEVSADRDSKMDISETEIKQEVKEEPREEGDKEESCEEADKEEGMEAGRNKEEEPQEDVKPEMEKMEVEETKPECPSPGCTSGPSPTPSEEDVMQEEAGCTDKPELIDVSQALLERTYYPKVSITMGFTSQEVKISLTQLL